MDPVTRLSDEHRLILRILDALEAAVTEVARSGADARPELGRFLVLFHRFVDGSHHAREEEVYFRALLAGDSDERSTLVAELLRAHALERELLGPLEDLAYQPHPWSATDRHSLARDAERYVAHARAHVHEEEQRLIPLVRDGATAEQRRALAAQLTTFELAQLEQDARLHRLADELVERHCPTCEHVHHAAARPPSGPTPIGPTMGGLVHAAPSFDDEASDDSQDERHPDVP